VRPIFHIGGFLAGTPGPFDIADHAGRSSDLLVRTAALGERLAEHLGNDSVVLMRGHGFTAVGQSIEEAVFRAVYTARNCEVQSAAMGLGDPVFLSVRRQRLATQRTGRSLIVLGLFGSAAFRTSTKN
jgi:HCOMODA/2-hydroxy-3-carboxy-muconic semialdehyde decarboxylase